MPHLLIAGQIHPAGLDVLREEDGITFDYVEEISETSYRPLLPSADALVIRTQPLTADAIAGANRLRFVSRHGVGYDSVDVAALEARGIPLAIVGDVNSVSVAEHAIALILGCAKRLVRGDRAVRDGGWGWRNRMEATELSGRRLLIVGYGRIGRRLAEMAAAFGMEVIAHDPPLAAAGWPAGRVRHVTLYEGLEQADVVSLHLPKGEGALIGPRELARMKRGAILVNTARGGIVDEGALAAALASGQIGAAGLDVFEAEPPSSDNPLWAFDTVILSPHIAGLSAESAERMAIASVRNVLDFFAGRLDPALIVNRIKP